MNKHCKSCVARNIPNDVKEDVFKMFFGKTITCPIDDERIICIYSKLEINWDLMISMLKKKSSNAKR
jgi:hypothetical protein